MESTLEPGPAALGHGPLRVPALTVVFHPHPRRVGQVALLASLVEGRVEQLSRTKPLFARPGASAVDGEPLAVRHLSREPATLTRNGGGVTVSPGGSPLRVDGAELRSPLPLRPEALERGVVLELADRVVLLLHLAGLGGPPLERLGLIGDSESIDLLRGRILRVAPLQVPVLLEGETGAGKELVARAITAASPRRTRPFVAVNMGAIPSSIATAELLGHARGAFTGATEPRQGHFAAADGGTLFLDEIGAAPPEVQAVLLRILETGELQPLGSDRTRRVDVRVIAATDQDLSAAVAAGSFREALLHRLAGYRLRVPPLRERREDLGRLLLHLLGSELEASREPAAAAWWPRLPAALVAQLTRHDWPGNVRQLANVARRLAVALAHGEAPRPELLPDLFPTMATPVAEEPMAPRRPGRERPDSEALRAALRIAGWRTSEAARALGISRSTLYALIDASPELRKARDLDRDELAACQHACQGDLARMAERLEVSQRGLLLRLRELGLG